jgi:hypothetical protein
MDQIGGMAYGDEDERMVQAAQRVAEGKRVVALQRILVARLKASGLRTVGAEQTPQMLSGSQAIVADDERRMRARGEKPVGTPMAHEQPSSDVDQRVKPT